MILAIVPTALLFGLLGSRLPSPFVTLKKIETSTK